MKNLLMFLTGFAAVVAAQWSTPTSIQRSPLQNFTGTEILQAKYDLNTDPVLHISIESVVQVGISALVGCFESPIGAEVSIATFDFNASKPVGKRLQFGTSGEQSTRLFVPLENFGPGDFDGCSEGDSFIPV